MFLKVGQLAAKAFVQGVVLDFIFKVHQCLTTLVDLASQMLW